MKTTIIIVALCVSASSQTNWAGGFANLQTFNSPTVSAQSNTFFVRTIVNNGNGTNTVAVASPVFQPTVGQNLTIAGSGTCNDGAWNVTATTPFSSGLTTATYTTGCTAPWQFETDKEAAMAKCANGTVLNFYRRGFLTSDVGDVGVIMQQSTANGIAFTTPVVRFQDSGTTCVSNTSHCDFRNPGAGTAANGNIVVAWTKYDWTNSSTIGVLWSYSSDCGSTWAAPQQISATAPDGNTVWSGTYAPLFVMTDGALVLPLTNDAGTVTYLFRSTDNGVTFPSGATPIRRLQDGGGVALPIPNNESTFVNPSGNKIIGFSRGCDTGGASCALKSLYSADAGVTWSMATMDSTMASCNLKDGSPRAWNQISPVLFPSVSGQLTLLFAERDSTPGAGSCSYLMQVTFDPATVTSAKTNYGRIQNIWQSSAGTPGFSDWGYPAAAMLSGNKVLLEWSIAQYVSGLGQPVVPMTQTAALAPATVSVGGSTLSGVTLQ